MYDVIIIGGGPTGSHTAYRLTEKGLKVLVLERKSGVGEKVCCTGIVGQECVDVFNINSKVILRKVNSAMLFSPLGKTLHLYRKEPQACILDRLAFNTFMAERAQRAGAEYQFDCRVIDINIASDHAGVTVLNKSKKSQIPAKALIIASGFNPELNQRVGLSAFKDFVTGVQAEVETPNLEEVEVYFGNIAPGFFSWLVPTARGMGKVGLMTRYKPGDFLKKWLKHLAEQGRIKSAEIKISYGGIPLKPPARTCCERLIAIGDAAGQVKPTTGGGIYYGLLGAEIAVDTLNRALIEDDFSEKSLARYERGWREKLGKELRTGYWARKLFEKLSERQIDLIFEIIKTSGIDEILLKAENLSFDWHRGMIMQLLKYQTLIKTLKLIKLPFKSNGIDR